MENVRVLIVDDLPQVRQELSTVLRLAASAAKVQIVIIDEAQDGKEAIEKTQSLHPDVVLIDLEMPRLDGYEATRRIKSLQPAPRVVVLSAHAGPAERKRAREAGADNFVVKGASYRILLNAILGKDRTSNSFDLEKGEKS